LCEVAVVEGDRDRFMPAWALAASVAMVAALASGVLCNYLG
jgi:hypothetical protein